MKSFNQFLSEAGSTAVQQATRLGLTTDGHGGWYKDGEFVAKTEKGQLKFYNKRQRIGEKDPAQSEKEKKLSHTTTASSEQQPKTTQAPAQQDPADDEVVVLEPPVVEKTKGTLTVAFGRFNPPTTGHEKLLDTVALSSDDGDYDIVHSRSQDKKRIH